MFGRFCLSQPSVTEKEVDQGDISPTFAKKVASVRQVLADELINEPHVVGGQPVMGGAMLSSLLTAVCDAVNEGSKDLQPLR